MYRHLMIMLLCISTVCFANEPTKAVFEDQEIACLTTAIVREAPNESDIGKLAVATVVINRTHYKEFASSICGVVYQRNVKGCQFSWVCVKHLPALDSALYAKVHQIARSVVVEGKRLSSIKNALYFCTTTINPHWDHVKLVQTIGNHAFYVAVR